LPNAELQWIDPRCTLRADRTYRCTIESIPQGTQAVVRASLIAPPGVTFVGTQAIFVSPEPLTPFSRNEDVTIRTPSKIVPAIVSMPDEKAWGAGPVSVELGFDAVVPPTRLLEPIRIAIFVPQVVSYSVPGTWSCTAGESRIDCTTAALTHDTVVVQARRTPLSAYVSVNVRVDFHERDYEPELVRAEATTYALDRDLLVTTTADVGAGSLRQTMLDAESCGQDERCRIAFAPEITSIRVLSPLPVIHARNVWIDGSYGRTSKMAIDGSALTSGNGIVFGPEVAQGRALGLAIHSFPGNGIECRGQCRIESNFIGLDRDGITPRGNGARGVYVSGGCEIENNVISGNWRSGIFVDGGGSGFAYRNLIGVAADGVTPIGNGASGLYVGPQSFSFRTFIAEDNVIAYSTHFGVAIAPGRRWGSDRQAALGQSADRSRRSGVHGLPNDGDVGIAGAGALNSLGVRGTRAVLCGGDAHSQSSLQQRGGAAAQAGVEAKVRARDHRGHTRSSARREVAR
jgi:parallel beta-helix repeat protein